MIQSLQHSTGVEGGRRVFSWHASEEWKTGSQTSRRETAPDLLYGTWCNHSPFECSVEIHQRPAFVVYVPSTEDVVTVALRALTNEARSASEASVGANAVRAVLVVAYSLEKQSLPRAAAKRLMHFVERNARFNELALTNLLLVELDMGRLSSRALLGVVRATARLQSKLPAWELTYARAWLAISEQGKNPHALFVGMEPPAETALAARPT